MRSKACLFLRPIFRLLTEVIAASFRFHPEQGALIAPDWFPLKPARNSAMVKGTRTMRRMARMKKLYWPENTSQFPATSHTDPRSAKGASDLFRHTCSHSCWDYVARLAWSVDARDVRRRTQVVEADGQGERSCRNYRGLHLMQGKLVKLEQTLSSSSS